jgi:ATP-dependent exoDNAse (exonuclease V) beta subunit
MTTGEDDRRLIASALDDTLVVEAAAGTGKTTALVGRIVSLVESRRARIDEIVAVTFSEKAAGELKLRLREQLEVARGRHEAGSAPADLLTRAVYDFEEAHVSTLHGFCAELLRARPVEARVDPSFEVLTDTQAQALFDEAFTTWLHDQLASPGEGVRRSLGRPSRWDADQAEESGPIARLRRAASELCEWRDHDAPWSRPSLDLRHAIDGLIEQLHAFAALTAHPLKKGDYFHLDTSPARRVSAEIARLQRIGGDHYDWWEAALVALADDRDFGRVRKGSGTAFAHGVARQQAHDAHASLLQHLKRFKNDADADLAALLHAEMRGCLDRYEARKLAAGALDFLDLLIKARDLVRDQPEVCRAFQKRFRYLLVDEFQDTDPLQAELLLLLAGDEHEPQAGQPPALSTQHSARSTRSGALFIVGDPKQSIYRFRRADVGAYGRISQVLASHGARRVTLQTSFRGVPAIQRFVNAAFRVEMTGDADALQAAYVPLGRHRPDHPSQPAIVALPVPRPYGKRDVTLTALEASQPPSIGAFVRWLVSADCPWTVDAPDPSDLDRRVRRRIVPSDVCLLFRRFLKFGEDVTRPYVEALEARDVPHLLVGGKTFHEREEVDAVRTALTAIEWPEDELSVFATLHGPLFAIGEEELLEYQARAHVFHPYRVPVDLPDRLAPVVAALALMRELHGTRNHRPVAETVGRLIDRTRAHAGFVLWQGGEQVLANVLHISDLARRYEGEGGLSFRGFVDQLHEAASRAEAPEAPILEEGSEGVRLMTVHKAKGLEFPVVVLADIGCKLSLEEASRYLDPSRGLCAIRIGGWVPLDLLEHNDQEARRDEAEGVRLAYVAATRARDVLVVPAVGDGPYQRGWLRPLNRALYPPIDRRQQPTAASGCPPFQGKDTVLDRPEGLQPDASTVRPGAYGLRDPDTDEPYTVVWWDPRLLDEPADDPRGIRRDDLISKEVRPEVVAADRGRLDQWRQWRDAALQKGSEPSMRILTVSDWSRQYVGTPDPYGGVGVHARPAAPACVPNPALDAAARAVEIADAGAAATVRPSGRRFGILVHALLAAVPLRATPGEVAALAAVHARMLGATDDERDAAVLAADRALRHPLLDRARAAESACRACRREVALSVAIADTLVDGQADLAFDDGDAWVIVDFKTDVEIAAAENAYRHQVALYVHAVTRATGRTARGVLLRI